MTLTKSDIVQEIYKNHDLTKAEATEAVESFLCLSKAALIKGSDLLLSGVVVLFITPDSLHIKIRHPH